MKYHICLVEWWFLWVSLTGAYVILCNMFVNLFFLILMVLLTCPSIIHVANGNKYDK